MFSGNKPSINPAYQGSLAGTLQFALGKFMQSSVNGMLPAQVISYDRTANRVQVQILITIVSTDGTQTSRGQLASIPVMVFGGGNLILSFPLKTGDLGWVCANDRDISLFLNTYTESPPNTGRMFSFSDAVFIPDVMRGYTIDSDDANNAVLQSIDGTVKISIGTTGVKVVAPTVTINSPGVQLGDISDALTGLMNNVAIAVFNDHVHSGVQTGTGNSGAPTTTLGSSALTTNVQAN